MFEPGIHPLVREFAGESLRPYLRHPDGAPALKAYYGRLLSGRVHSPWIDQTGFRPWSDTLILKLIRANLMLPWLAANFPQVPIVLLLRHPVPVARSAVAQGWESPLESLLATPGLPAWLVAAARPALAYPAGSYEQWVAHWALEAALMVEDGRALGAPVHYYEVLRRDPARAFPRLARDGGLALDHFDPGEVGRASITASDPGWKAAEDVDAWLADCPASQLAWADRMIAAFGLGDLYEAGSPMPLGFQPRDT